MRFTFIKLLVAVLALSLCALAQASITPIGIVTAAATTVTCSTHLAGDFMLMQAVRGGSTTAPTLPSGWVSILTKSNSTATSVSMRAAYRIATSTSDASGTWTNASELICSIFRPSSGSVIRIGQSASASSTTATVSFTGLTLADSTSGNSWVLGLVGAGNTTQVLTTAPSGMTNEAARTGSTSQASLDDTNAGVSSWSTATANVTSTGSTVAATLELVLAPKTAFSGCVYQHVTGGGNPSTQGQSGTVYKLPLDTISGSGNAIVLGITNDGGATISSIADNINGAWPAATVTSLQGTGNLDSRIYVKPNITSGQITITVTYSAAVASFEYDVTELCHVAASPGAGSSSNGATQVTTTAVSSFTPTNNNSTGGNVIWAYFVKADAAPGNITTGLFAGSPFTLLGAVSSWLGTGGYQMPNVVEAAVQTTSAAIAPAMTSVAESGDHWNNLAVALQVCSSCGTLPPSGIQISAVHHLSTVDFPTAGTYVMQCPMTGNLHLIVSVDPNLNSPTLSDNEGNSLTPGATGAGFWFLPNATADPNYTVFVTGGGMDAQLSWRCVDITGAATSPYDGSIATPVNLNGLSTFTASPSPSPSAANELVIESVGLGEGPGLTVNAPTGAIWDLATYTGETDTDLMENADIMAHYHTSASGSESWTNTITNEAMNSSSGGFIYFKPAPTVGGPPAGQFFLEHLVPANDDHFLLIANGARR